MFLIEQFPPSSPRENKNTKTKNEEPEVGQFHLLENFFKGGEKKKVDEF